MLGTILGSTLLYSFEKLVVIFLLLLAHMFKLEGQLDQDLGWRLLFVDNERDLVPVGDDPWEYVTLLF